MHFIGSDDLPNHVDGNIAAAELLQVIDEVIVADGHAGLARGVGKEPRAEHVLLDALLRPLGPDHRYHAERLRLATRLFGGAIGRCPRPGGGNC